MAKLATGFLDVSTNDQSSYNSTLLSSQAGQLYLAFAAITGFTGIPVFSSVIASAPGFLLVAQASWGAGANIISMEIGGGFLPTLVATAGVNANTSPVTATGCSFGEAIITGMSRVGLGAVRQYVALSAQTAGSTPQVVFPAAVSTENPVFAVVACSTNPPALTAPTGFGKIRPDTGYATPTTGVHWICNNSAGGTSGNLGGFSGTTLTWGSTCATEFAVIAVELDIRGDSADDHPAFIGGWRAA